MYDAFHFQLGGQVAPVTGGGAGIGRAIAETFAAAGAAVMVSDRDEQTAASDPTSLPAYRAIAEHLMATDKTPLLGREWVIENIAGGGIIDRSHATLQFFADGRLAGSASCNRILGSYRSEGAKLKIAPAGTTMMACPPALMNQERTWLALLPKVESYQIDATGALVLRTSDGQEIVARR